MNAQNQEEGDEKFDYEFHGYIKLKKMNIEPTENDELWTAEKYRYNVVAEDIIKFGENEFEYVVLQLLNFSSNYKYVRNANDSLEIQRRVDSIVLESDKRKFEISKMLSNEVNLIPIPDDNIETEVELYQTKIEALNNQYSLETENIEADSKIAISQIRRKSDSIIGIESNYKIGMWPLRKDRLIVEPYKYNYVDIDDENKKFWIKKDKFNQYIEKGFIKKRFSKKIQVAYGASLSVPFKIRPEVGDRNIKITPDLALGGYIGFRYRLNKYKPIYWYLPVITAGVTTIGINSDNLENDTVVDEVTMMEIENSSSSDGLVFARTFTIGSFVEFDSFQVGFVAGWDRPGGEIAKDWIYNDRLWYSFSIGYNFLRRSDSK